MLGGYVYVGDCGARCGCVGFAGYEGGGETPPTPPMVQQQVGVLKVPGGTQLRPALHIAARGTFSPGQCVSLVLPALTGHDREAPHTGAGWLLHPPGEGAWGFPPMPCNPSREGTWLEYVGLPSHVQ